MNYFDYNDNELLSYICENNEDANEIIFNKYKPVIKSLAVNLYKYCQNVGIEISDLEQEGLLGLDAAINTFDEQKNVSFMHYARMCIRSKMISSIMNTRTKKNRILNMSLSLDSIYEEENNCFDKIVCDKKENPEKVIITSEENDKLIEKIKEKLTSLELQVFELKMLGFYYKEIGKILDVDIKVVDNAMQRIKIKTKKIIQKNPNFRV